MGDKYEEAFNEIVLAVTRLMFGDVLAASSIHFNLVRYALLRLGLEKIIDTLKEESA